MKVLSLILLFAFVLYAKGENIIVNAKSFEADEKKNISIFKGDVSIQKGDDYIKADTLKIYFNKKNKPTKYKAIGNVKFELFTNKQHFKGNSNTIEYSPLTKLYKASGHVFLTDLTQHRKLRGENIIIDRIHGKTKINGTKKRPVKFIFSVEE